MSFPDVYSADRRLGILQVLSAAGAPANPVMLRSALEEATAHRPSMDVVTADVLWLKDRGLVVTEGDGVALGGVTLTVRGEDVALGRAKVLGVAAPGLDH